MVGILVHGDNHFIVRGPLPDREIALALVRHWSLIQIGATTPPSLDRWHIVSREFRENLNGPWSYRETVRCLPQLRRCWKSCQRGESPSTTPSSSLGRRLRQPTKQRGREPTSRAKHQEWRRAFGAPLLAE